MRTDRLFLVGFCLTLFLVSTAYAEAFGTIGYITAKTNGATIDVTYVPSCNFGCNKIMIIQTVSRKVYLTGDGWTPFKPSDVTADWAEKDASTVDGTTVDYINGELDPYYNGNDAKDIGAKGSSAGDGNTAHTANATIQDRPHYTDGAMNALQNKFGNPVGKTIDKIVLEFEDCAFCADGKNKGQTYGCLKWKYEQKPGMPGTSTKGGTSGDPSTSYTNAVNAWATAHGFSMPKSG